MLDNLSSIPWNELEHAYGQADDVPDLLLRLLSKDQDIRSKAYYSLYGNVFHQGTIYEVTPFVVPFLFEILDSDDTEDKHDLIEYILHLFTGYPEYYLPYGIDKNIFDTEGTDYYKEVFNICVQNQEIFCKCTYSQLELTQIAAVFALAYLANDLKDEVYARIKQIAFQSKDAKIRSNALIALGIVEHQKGSKASLENMKNVFQNLENETSLEKIAAACAIITVDGTAVNKAELLYIANITSESFEEMEDLLPWSEGNLHSYVSAILSKVDKVNLDLCITTITDYLKDISATNSVKVTDSLLNLVLKANEGIERPYKFEAFSKVSQDALITIGKHGGWQFGEGQFVNYSMLLKAYGFPATKDDYLQFLNER